MPVNRMQPCSRRSMPISGSLACLLTAGLLTSCSGMPTAPSPVTKVQAPEQCLVAPSPLPLLVDKSLEGVLRHLILVAGEWHDLRIRPACLAEFERLR